MVRRGFEKLSQIRHEQTRAGVGRRGHGANAIVVVGIHLPPNIDEALAENIDPALARVVERSGTLTKTRVPTFSSWKDSGWASMSMFPTCFPLVSRMASAPPPPGRVTLPARNFSPP